MKNTGLINLIKRELSKKSSKQKIQILQKFFKAGKGEYGEGDIFIGVTVPEIRKIALTFFKEANLNDVKILLQSKIHEERLCALEILVAKYELAENNHEYKQCEKIFNLYLKKTKRINNWDLVDLSAPYIVGSELFRIRKNKKTKLREILEKLSDSKLIWDRRIAIVSMFYFIKQGNFDEILFLAKKLLKDKEDLIHKSLGWMLREVGKKDITVLKKFIRKFQREMPRVMFRYSIERFSPKEKGELLKTHLKDI